MLLEILSIILINWIYDSNFNIDNDIEIILIETTKYNKYAHGEYNEVIF